VSCKSNALVHVSNVLRSVDCCIYTCACMNKVYMHECTNLIAAVLIRSTIIIILTSLSPDPFPRSTHLCAFSTQHFRRCSYPTAFIPLISRVRLSGASILGEPPIAIPLMLIHNPGSLI